MIFQRVEKLNLWHFAAEHISLLQRIAKKRNNRSQTPKKYAARTLNTIKCNYTSNDYKQLF